MLNTIQDGHNKLDNSQGILKGKLIPNQNEKEGGYKPVQL